jgi:periplasmic copper chaperone A
VQSKASNQIVRVLVLALLFVPLAAAAAGGRAKAPLRIVDAWARETPGGATTSAAYFVVENPGAVADSLLEVTTPIAGMVELHTMDRQGDVMRMRRVFSIDVPAGGSVTLEPGGFHVMLMELKEPLVAGDRFALTLLFGQAGEMIVDVEVRPLREMASTRPRH